MGLVHVKELLTGLFEKFRISEERQEIFTSWDKQAARFAAHAQIVGIKNNELTVNVDSSVYLQELLFVKNQLIAGMNGEIKGDKIKDIKFRMGKV